MTSLRFPWLSSQSVSGFLGSFRPENPEMDWDDKPGLPRVVIPVPLLARKTRNGLRDKPGLPRVVIPVRFGFLLPLFGQKTPKRFGMTSLGFPGLSSQSILGFFCPFRPEKPETDWDDKRGVPRVVIPVREFLEFFGPKTPKPTGMTSLGFPGLSSQSIFGFLAPFGQKSPKQTGMTNLGFPGLSSQSVSGFCWPFSARKPQKGLG